MSNDISHPRSAASQDIDELAGRVEPELSLTFPGQDYEGDHRRLPRVLQGPDCGRRFGGRGGMNSPRCNCRDLLEENESLRHQAEYERLARVAAANFPRNRHGYIPCERCGLDCGMDAMLDDALWAQISPNPEIPEAGMLCLWCMDELLTERRLSGEVRLYFRGKALTSA